jgi:hypothetical protein
MRIRVLLFNSKPGLTPEMLSRTAHVIGYWDEHGSITIYKDRFHGSVGKSLDPCEFDRYIEDIQIFEEYKSLLE